MELYKKVIRFAFPFWKHIAFSFLLTLLYILFNSLTLWVSIDFVKELFLPADPLANSAGQVTNLIDSKGIYDTISSAIKSVLIQSNRFETLRMVCLVIFISYLLKNILEYYRRVLLSYIELKIVTLIRDTLTAAMVRFPLSYFEKNKSGELASIVFNDVAAVNQMITNSFGRMLLSPFQILFNVLIMFIINWHLSLFTLTVIPLSVLSIWWIGKSIRRRSRRVFMKIGAVYNNFHEMVSSIRVIKAFSGEDHETTKIKNANREFLKANFRAVNLTHLTSPLNEVLIVIALVFLLWYGGSMVYNEVLAAEDFMRFLIFMITIFQPLKELTQVNNVIQNGMAAAERIIGAMETVPEVYEHPNARPLGPFSTSIEFRNVSFRYAPDLPLVLQDLNLTVKKGQTVAFVGHSGAGKTTTVDLVPRFYDLAGGTLYIDGFDIQHVTLNSLREQIGIVAQESVLFNETIRYNIGYGVRTVTDADIIEAAKRANAWEFIQKMENGLDTVTGERGVKLSGGQKQRLSIARAILKNPPILILDEATSALDTESEKLVQDAIYTLMKNRTVLVIAHRLSTIIHADLIVVMSDGRIVATGTHQELLKQSPDYRKLYTLQFQSNDPKKSDS